MTVQYRTLKPKTKSVYPAPPDIRAGVLTYPGLGSGLASCHWEATLTAREASPRKEAGKWQDLTPGLAFVILGRIGRSSNVRPYPVSPAKPAPNTADSRICWVGSA